MDLGTLESAYEPFLATLREGGFQAPAEGWPAELVAAHVARNNELIAEVAEKIVAGEQPTYDNRTAVDDAELRAFSDAVGGIAGLAEAVEASARRQARAWSALADNTAGYMLPVVIVDGGRVMRDDPVPIRSFIEGNASFHLDMHLEQLRALQP